MRLSFTPAATAAERAAAERILGDLGIEFEAADGGLLLRGTIDPGDAIALAAVPGVAAIAPSARPEATLREAVLAWVGGAATVLGVLSIVAANLPPSIGASADPLRTPQPLRPSWPLLAWYAAVDRCPSWVPVPLFFVIAAIVLFFWPDLARPLATKRPAVHAALGVLALLALAGLIAMEAGR